MAIKKTQVNKSLILNMQKFLSISFPFNFFSLNLLLNDRYNRILSLTLSNNYKQFFLEIIINFLQQEVEIGYDLKKFEIKLIENRLFKELETSQILSNG